MHLGVFFGGGVSKETKSLWRPRHRWEDIWWEGVNWINLVQDRVKFLEKGKALLLVYSSRPHCLLHPVSNVPTYRNAMKLLSDCNELRLYVRWLSCVLHTPASSDCTRPFDFIPHLCCSWFASHFEIQKPLRYVLQAGQSRCKLMTSLCVDAVLRVDSLIWLMGCLNDAFISDDFWGKCFVTASRLVNQEDQREDGP